MWRVLQWICRIVLGALFVYAGYTKVTHHLLFAMTVDTYQLLPVWGVRLVAAVLPWLEIVLGALLLVGWKLQYFGTFTALLLAAFIAAMSITYARGIEANCGCFGLGEPITPYTLTRDSFMLAMAVYMAVTAWRWRAAPAVA